MISVPHKPAAGVFHDRKSFRQNFVQPRGQFLVVLDFGKLLLPRGGFLPQGIVRKLLASSASNSLILAHHGTKPFYFAVVFRADELFYDKSNHG